MDETPRPIRQVFADIAADLAADFPKLAGRITAWQGRRSQRRRRRLQAELQATRDQLDASLLQLAGLLGADAHRARQALIRASYRAAGSGTPDAQQPAPRPNTAGALLIGAVAVSASLPTGLSTSAPLRRITSRRDPGGPKPRV